MGSPARLVIGLDYGTTYTGVAFADSSCTNVHDIQLITDWPGFRRNVTDEKVPSQVAYGEFTSVSKNYSWGTWGNQIPNGAPRQLWTKLKLDESKRPRDLELILALLSDNFDGLRLNSAGEAESDGESPLLPPGKEPVDVVADYLTGVKDFAFEAMQKTLSKALFDSLSLELVMTVPAVWSDRAKNLTYQAVTTAGWCEKARIKMVTEPEAAAVYTLKMLQEKFGKEFIKPNDYFVLCDAGGGTVDLLSYRVKSVEGSVRVEEAAVGTGDKCGATFIDRGFKAWLKKKLGDEVFASIPAVKLQEDSKIRRDFDRVKNTFDGSESENYLSLPKEAQREDDPVNGFVDGELRIKTADLEEIFEPCVKRTLELIDGQVTEIQRNGARVKSVFLVGGFGKSNYLFKKVDEYCTQRGFTAMRPANPWSAVARGAVARGLEPDGGGMVELRLCRHHYGTPVSDRFDPSIHDPEDAYIDQLTGEKRARGQMSWMLHKGDSLPVNTPKRVAIECTTRFKPGDDRIFRAQLAYCTDAVAPRRYAEDSVIPNCVVTADMSSVPESKLMKARARAGETFYIAEFKIELEVDNARLKFFLTFEGEECGLIEAKFDG